MDLFEHLFKKYVSWKRNRKEIVDVPQEVRLEDVKHRLALVACAFSGRPIEIFTAEDVGGCKGNVFYLPACARFSSDPFTNFKFYLFRVLFLVQQQEMGLHLSVPRSTEEAEEIAHNYSESIIKNLIDQYPNLKTIYLELKNIVEERWLYGKFMSDNMLHSVDVLEHVSNVDKNPENQPAEIKTEIRAKPVEDVETVQLDKEKQEEFVLTHNFEKIETAEEFDDIWRDFDGDDSLEDDLDAIQDISLKHTVRVDDVVHSVYKAEFTGTMTIAQSKELKEHGFFYEYDEWSAKERQLLLNHCKVFPLLFRGQSTDFARRVLQDNSMTLEKLKRALSNIRNKLNKINRVIQGEEFDLDEVIDFYCDIKARRTPNERIYLSRRRKRADLSILFLIDLSLSSDSYVANRKVIEVEKEAVILLGEAFDEYQVDFQVDGFFSKTRNFCNYVTLKHFRDKWDSGKRNISGIGAMGFTRIGPALRHAQELIMKRPGKKKWIILLSDGKPNDYDRYGGQYGVKDVQHAIRNLGSKNIGTYALAIEEEAKFYLPQMFGTNHYNIITHPEKLPEAMFSLYQKIANT